MHLMQSGMVIPHLYHYYYYSITYHMLYMSFFLNFSTLCFVLITSKCFVYLSVGYSYIEANLQTAFCLLMYCWSIELTVTDHSVKWPNIGDRMWIRSFVLACSCLTCSLQCLLGVFANHFSEMINYSLIRLLTLHTLSKLAFICNNSLVTEISRHFVLSFIRSNTSYRK